MTANVFEPEFDASADDPGFTYRRGRLGRQAGAERLGASLYELAPGQATFPYHYHQANEEMLIVLSGRPSLRDPDGWRELEAGELVALPRGERGAHQVANRSDGLVRFLVLSEMNAPELTVYPDEGKVGALERAPGARGSGGQWFFREADAVGYLDGVEPPADPR